MIFYQPKQGISIDLRLRIIGYLRRGFSDGKPYQFVDWVGSIHYEKIVLRFEGQCSKKDECESNLVVLGQLLIDLSVDLLSSKVDLSHYQFPAR